MSFLRDSFQMLLWRVVSIALGALTAVLIARWLGPEARGLYALLLVYIGFAALVLQFGLPEASIYLLGAKVFAVEKTTFTLLAWFGGIGVLALAGCVTVSHVFLETSLARALLLGGALAASILVVALRHLLLAHKQFGRYSATVAFEAILYLAAIIVLHFQGALTVDGALAAYLIGQAGSLCVLLLGRTAGAQASAPHSFEPGVIKQGLRHGMHLFATGLGGFGVARIGYLLLEWLAGTRAVGLFAAASALPVLFANVPQQFATVLYSHVSTEGAERGGLLTASVFKLMAVVGLAALLPLYLLREHVVALLFGAEFAGIGIAMVILCASMLITGLNGLLFNALAGVGFAHSGTVLTVVLLSLLCAFGYLLIPSLGLTGAALAQLCASSISLMLMGAIFCRRLAVPFTTLLVPRVNEWRGLLRRPGGRSA